MSSTKSGASTQPISEFKRLFLVILLGIVGALINLVPISLLPDTQLVFGNAAYVFVAMYLLPRYAVLTAIIAVSPLYFLTEYNEYVLIFVLEAIVIAFMRARGWYILLADMMFWLVIGLPITIVYLWLQHSPLSMIDAFVIFKHGFNGLWYTSVACFIVFILNQKLRINLRHQITIHRTLRSKLMFSLVLVTIIALFSSTLFISNHFLQISKSIVHKSLEESSKNVEVMTESLLDKYARSLYLIDDWLASQNTTNFTYILERTKEHFPKFQDLYITKENSDVISYTSNKNKNVIGQNLPLATSPSYDLFMPLEHDTPLKSSNVFSIDDKTPVIRLNTTYHSIINNQHYRLQGILELSQTRDLYSIEIGGIGVDIILVDTSNAVIQASSKLDLQTLDEFKHEPFQNKDNLLMLKNGSVYYYKMIETSYGWKIYSLVDYYQATNSVKEDYVIVFLILFFTLLATTYFAYEYGTRLTQPVDYIIKQLTKFNSKKSMPSNLAASVEVIQLYDEIMANRDKLYEYQDLLEEKVIERTKELNKANNKLEELALLDSLTKVNNRRYLDDNFTIVQKTAHRNLALMSLIMVDLDFFKKLNDQYGHLVGDNCLTGVAQLIKEAFDRASDIVVRFGGEEFVIVAPYITPAALELKLEELRASIEAFVFYDEDKNPINITASFGAIIADASYSEDVLQWIQQADECLYEAKEATRNCYRIRDKVSRLDNQ